MVKTASLADALFEKLEHGIMSGEMGPNTKLPPQKDIAEQEQVSRTVVREAVARLEAHGLVMSRQGAGVYVTDNAKYRAFQVTKEELSEISDVIDLLETRLAVESEMAALAASRRTTNDIVEMRKALQAMADVADDPEAAAAADAAFHLAIGRATRNDYFVRLIDFLGVRLVPSRDIYLRNHAEDTKDAYTQKLKGEHEAILDAIVKMDVEGARAAARAHMLESLNRHSELGMNANEAAAVST